MKRRVVKLLVALSLLLFAAIVALWVRSFFVYDGIARYTYGPAGSGAFSRVRYVRSERGGIILCDSNQYLTHPAAVASVQSRAPEWDIAHDRTGGPRWDTSELSEILSFDVEASRGTTPGSTWTSLGVRIPYWAPALAAAIAPVWWLARGRNWRRRQRVAQGRCAGCGYDLRASPTKCPECGALAATDR